MVWLDCKTANNEIHYYFPSLLTTYITEKNKYLNYLK
jgi:hypothetical protein